MKNKECPFCGGVELEYTSGTEDREGIPASIVCSSCGCHGPWTYISNEAEFDQDLPPTLLKLWNKRA
jgi:Lar family restriction alleviation protein